MTIIITAKILAVGGTFTLFGERLFGNIATSVASQHSAQNQNHFHYKPTHLIANFPYELSQIST